MKKGEEEKRPRQIKRRRERTDEENDEDNEDNNKQNFKIMIVEKRMIRDREKKRESE